MFFYTSNKIDQNNITFHVLSELDNAEQCLVQIAEWIENKWGYLRKNPGLAYRINALRPDMINTIVALYAGQPVGVFALKESDYDKSIVPGALRVRTKELWFVYVDESFRHLGVGSRIVTEAKRRCALEAVERIVFDTLTPGLHSFYKKQGAVEVCESKLIEAPVTIMRI